MYLASFGELLESLDGVPEVGARPESHIDALALVEVERERILRLADRPADDGAASDGEEHVFVSAVDGDHAQLGCGGGGGGRLDGVDEAFVERRARGKVGVQGVRVVVAA